MAWPWGQFEPLTLSYETLYPQGLLTPPLPTQDSGSDCILSLGTQQHLSAGLVAFGALQVGREFAFLQRALSRLV